MVSDEVVVVEPLDVSPGDVEGWANAAGGRFEQSYRYLRTKAGFRPGPCFVGAWLSMGTDDRGNLRTFAGLAEWLGVARQTAYGWRATYRLDEWAEQLRLLALRGDHLGEVDQITYKKAVDPESAVDARRLYYQRAGVLGQEFTILDETKEERLQSWVRELREVEKE